MHRLKTLFLAAGCLALFVGAALAQEQPKTCAAERRNSNMPAVHISYDHHEHSQAANGKKNGKLWLRVHNNTLCRLEVPVDQRRSGPRAARNEKGALVQPEVIDEVLKISRAGTVLANEVFAAFV